MKSEATFECDRCFALFTGTSNFADRALVACFALTVALLRRMWYVWVVFLGVWMLISCFPRHPDYEDQNIYFGCVGLGFPSPMIAVNGRGG